MPRSFLLLSFLFPLMLLRGYDPLVLPEAGLPAPIDHTLTDAARNREIPIRIWLPATSDPAPVILFSHGLGGSRKGNPYLGKHWAGRGYVVIFLQHIGSDRSVWEDAPRLERASRLKSAANLKQTLLRFDDVHAVLKALPSVEALSGRIDMDYIGMSGHSYGAGTTQGLSGQRYARGSKTASQIDAALIMSPSLPNRGNPTTAFAKVQIPWFLMTGTKDGSPIRTEMKPETRAKVYDHLPVGDHLLLNLKDAEHYAFGDGNWRKRKRNPNHHKVILAFSTAFWDAHLKENAEAAQWLKGSSAKDLLQTGDVLKIKQPVDETKPDPEEE